MNKLLKIWNERQLVRYGMVGGLGTIYDYLLFTVLVSVGVDKIIANTTSFIFATLLAFIGHRAITFKHRKTNSKKSLAKFFVVNTSGLLLSNLILIIAVDYLGQTTNIGKISAIVITVIILYLINSVWSFSEE